VCQEQRPKSSRGTDGRRQNALHPNVKAYLSEDIQPQLVGTEEFLKRLVAEVLDRIPADERERFAGVRATTAGGFAVNAACMPPIGIVNDSANTRLGELGSQPPAVADV
jgi:hypothetical protein